MSVGMCADDGYVYVGTGAGALLRFDAKNAHFEYLGKPLLDARIEGLVMGKDGLIYGAGGHFETELFAYDREQRKFYNCGPIYDPDRDERCVIPHDMCITDDGVIYTGETDNLHRSTCFLWECEVTM